MGRIPIVGGVSSSYVAGNGRSAPSIQFSNENFYTDSIVAALIDSGVPMGISLCRGLQPTQHYLHVKKLSSDRKRIEEFTDGKPEDVFGREQGLVFLGDGAKKT